MEKKPKLHVKVSPKQMEVATQIVGLHCQPVAQTHTQEGETTLGSTAKAAALEAMKTQFYSVYGKTINEDVFSTKGSTSTSSSLVVTKEKYGSVVRALQLYATTKKKDQFMKNCYTRFSLGINLKDNC